MKKTITIMTSEGIVRTKSMSDEDVILQWQKNSKCSSLFENSPINV